MYRRLRDLREDRDLSQTHSKYETGENDIPTEVLIKLANFYGTSIDYLLDQTRNPKRNK